MKIAKLLSILLLITCVLSCSVKNSSDMDEPEAIKPAELSDMETLLNGLEKSLYPLVVYGEEIDDELIQRILLEYLDIGSGFGMFSNYVFDLEIGKMPPDTCKTFALGMIDGKWSSFYKEGIRRGGNPISTLKTIVFLYRSLETDYPEIAKKLLDNYFDLIDKIETPNFRAMKGIFSCKILHLSGFSGMEEKLIDSIELFIEATGEMDNEITPLEVFNQVAEISSVDYESAMMFAEYFIDEEYHMVECKAAIAGGLMRSDYERGRNLFLEASNEIVKFEYNPDAKAHATFEFAYTNLNENDKEKYVKKYFEVLHHYKRVAFLPPTDRIVIKKSEPELPSWYRDQLFKWLNDNCSVSERVELILIELARHCYRYPNSNNTEIFIGWLLDWIDKLETPKEKYISLGKLLTTHNAVIPNNISIARTRMEKIINGIKHKLPEMDLDDSLLSVAFFKEPANFKEKLGDGSAIKGDQKFINGFIGIMQFRHHFFPDDDAGIADLLTELAEDCERVDLKQDYELFNNLSAMWAGWDDDKAWKIINSLDKTSGEFPSLLIKAAYVTKSYAPGFSAGCIDRLCTNYTDWEFNLSNPAMETFLIKSLSNLSILRAEQLADIIVEHRGKDDPAFSFYNLRAEILKSAHKLNAGEKELVRITSEMQDKLREDFKFEDDGNPEQEG